MLEVIWGLETLYQQVEVLCLRFINERKVWEMQLMSLPSYPGSPHHLFFAPVPVKFLEHTSRWKGEREGLTPSRIGECVGAG